MYRYTLINMLYSIISSGKEKKEEEEKEINAKRERYEALYNAQLLLRKKPYCNPEFSIVQLAEDLNSNVKYISRAIRLKENVNFSVFLNMYRINLIKK